EVTQMREQQNDTSSEGLKLLLKATPSPPKHERSEPPTGWFDRPYNKEFYRSFAGFANAMNKQFAETEWRTYDLEWRLNHLADTDVADLRYDVDPTYGFRYRITCGQALLGRLTIRPKAYLSWETFDLTAPQVSVHVELSNATELGFAPIYDFLITLASWLAHGDRE